MGYVHALTEKVAGEISSHNGQHTAEQNWIDAEGKVQRYFSMRNWRNPEGDIAWYLENGQIPLEYQNGRRHEKAWEYLVLDVFQLPRVADSEEVRKDIKGRPSFLTNGLLEDMRGFVGAGVDDERA
jgi:hypothetical protein